MLNVIGDISVKSLPDVVSKAVGCKDFAKTSWDRCKMAPLPEMAFHKIDWSPEVKIPRGYLELGDTIVGHIAEWQILHSKCCCGHLRWINRRELLRKYGADARTKDLEKLLKCRRCEKRGWAIFIVTGVPLPRCPVRPNL
ncbi:hypothetical protein [Rhizobium rhizogenes]|uniref:hypothetical protein n=1 Tax=Rhizobium rhizogenes TaxID=359 RepID=UPI0002DD6D9C|nr:hypothetical protein A6U88_32110 [Agrobacterium sp. B131/95]